MIDFTEDCSGKEDQLFRLTIVFWNFFFSHHPIYYIHFSCNKFPIFDLKFFWKCKIFAKLFYRIFWLKNCFTRKKIFSKFYITSLSEKSFPKYIGRPTLAYPTIYYIHFSCNKFDIFLLFLTQKIFENIKFLPNFLISYVQ